MKMIMLTGAAMLTLAMAGVAVAQPGPGGHERGDRPNRAAMGLMMLGAADYNGDNAVTRAEVQRLHGEEFDFRDRNGDGFLDRNDASPTRQRLAEMRGDEAGQRRGRRGMARLDGDSDGRISRDEFINRETRLFDRLDANSDGTVSADELDAAIADRQARLEDRRESRMWWRN